MYQMWGNPQNIDTIRSLYAKRIPFPFNFYYPSKYIMKTNQVCETVASFSLEDPIENHETTDVTYIHINVILKYINLCFIFVDEC